MSELKDWVDNSIIGGVTSVVLVLVLREVVLMVRRVRTTRRAMRFLEQRFPEWESGDRVMCVRPTEYAGKLWKCGALETVSVSMRYYFLTPQGHILERDCFVKAEAECPRSS